MNWSDEHYVKLYTRDSLTWRSWHWEARTVFLHLVRKVDNSGFIETGTMSVGDALALQLELPKAVVEPGMAQLIGCGTCEVVDRAVLLVKFNEAQEARKTDAQKKRDERSRNISKRRGTMSPGVTDSHRVSPPVTQTDPPSPAQPVPSPAQPEKKGTTKKPVVSPDPRLQPLKLAMVADYESVRPGEKYAHQGAADTEGLKRLLPLATDDKIRERWRLALRRTEYPRVSTFAQLAQKWPDLAAPSPGKGPDPNAGIIQRPLVYVRPPQRELIEVPPEMEIPL